MTLLENRVAIDLALPSGVCVVFAAAGPTYTTTVPSSIMDQFRASAPTGPANVWVYANSLFGLLAIIEFAWSAAVMLLEKSDLQSWTSALIRKMMWLGAFYALLLYGGSWIPAIIDSFTAIGQNRVRRNCPFSRRRLRARSPNRGRPAGRSQHLGVLHQPRSVAGLGFLCPADRHLLRDDHH